MPSLLSMRSAKRATVAAVTPAPPPLSLRLGEAGARALEELARARGVTKAEAARQAIEEAGERERRREGLAAEVRRLSEDPDDVREMQEVAKLMEEMRAPW